MTTIPYIAIDFESYYDNEYGIKESGVYNYLHDARYDAYLISIYGNGISWVGHPKDFDWSRMPEAYDALAHNAGFDRLVFDRCIELGIIPAASRPKHWFCTANLSVYLGGPRNLKDAAKYLLGKDLSKEMRNYMKGKTWDVAVAEGKDKLLLQYALDDSINCYEIWEKYNDQWPEIERQAAELTFVQTQRGIKIDTELLLKSLPNVKAARDEALAGIPWVGELDPNGDEWKPTAAAALKAWCKDNGIEPPTTTEAKSPEFKEWMEQHPEVTCVKAMQNYRSSNAWYMKGTTLANQVNPDGTYNFSLLYFGATTGRWSGGFESDKADSMGFNIQNLVKGEHYGLDIRRCLIARPGKKFVIADFSQIEPRCLMWLTDDKKSLELLRKGMAVYEVHARAKMGWDKGNLKKTGGKLYDLAKARVIALGYGTGWAKLIVMCIMFGIPLSIFEDPITNAELASFKRYLARTNQAEKTEEFEDDMDWVRAVNAWKVVQDYRSSETGVTGFWKMLEQDCKRSINGTYTVELPSGRKLRYFNVRGIGGLTCCKTMHDKAIKIWGGFLTENVVQAMARDVMLVSMLRAEAAGYTSLFTVHDEMIFEVDENCDASELEKLLIQPPEWAADLPLGVSFQEGSYYCKD
jgi:hypothetical protein